MRALLFRPAFVAAAALLVAAAFVGLIISLSGDEPGTVRAAARPTTSQGDQTRQPTASSLQTPPPSATPVPSLASPTDAPAAAGQTPPATAAGPAPVVVASEAAVAPEVMPQTECGLRVDAIEALLGDSPATANDQLRDAVSVLDDRITQGRQAAETQPELIPALDLAERVLALWRDAVTALDNEDQAAADAAMAQAAAEIDTARAMAGGAESC